MILQSAEPVIRMKHDAEHGPDAQDPIGFMDTAAMLPEPIPVLTSVRLIAGPQLGLCRPVDTLSPVDRVQRPVLKLA